jgi:hypothetical protein
MGIGAHRHCDLDRQPSRLAINHFRVCCWRRIHCLCLGAGRLSPVSATHEDGREELNMSAPPQQVVLHLGQWLKFGIETVVVALALTVLWISRKD